MDYSESYRFHAEQIEKNPNYIRTLHRPPKGLIAYALSLDPHSYPLPLRLKKNYKMSSKCCLYHNNRDLRRGYKPIVTSGLPMTCRSVSQNKNLSINDYSSLPIANLYYGDDIDRILRYAGHNLGVLDQLEDDLADELKEFLIVEHNNQPSFFTKLLKSLHQYILEMYGLN